MKFLIILLLIGVAVYYAVKWSGSQKDQSSSGNNRNPIDPESDKSSNANSGTRNSDSYTNNGSANQGRAGSNSYARWIGGGLGWAFGGPIGGILGFMFGSMVGGMNSGRYEYGKTQSGDFNISLLILTAAVMKVDGNIKRSELDFVKRFFVNQFGEKQAVEYVRLLGEVLKQELNIPEVTAQIRQYMDYSSRLLLVQYLFGVALADGKHHPSEVTLIQSISGFLGISPKEFESMKAMFIKETDSAYKILEIEASASNEDVKKAYREMAKIYHPDKVHHLGEDVKKAAEEKFTKLNAAYETIKQERGMN